MKTSLLLSFALLTGCAVAEPWSEDSTIDTPLTGGVTLTEVSVPTSVQDAMEEVFGSRPTIRRFTIAAPGSPTLGLRIRGALEGLFARTKLGGNYSVKKYCSKLHPAETTAAGCAEAILAGPAEAGALDDHLELWAGDVQAADVATVRNYLASMIGTPGEEHDLDVEVGHWEDGEWWRDYTAHRAILFDANVTQVVIVRYYSGGSL
jgi:hypothetical protein